MRITTEELYGGHDLTHLKLLNHEQGIYRRIELISVARAKEVHKIEPDYSIVKGQTDAIKFWYDRIKEMQ